MLRMEFNVSLCICLVAFDYVDLLLCISDYVNYAHANKGFFVNFGSWGNIAILLFVKCKNVLEPAEIFLV